MRSKMRLKIAKMKPKMVKMRAKMFKMRPKMVKPDLGVYGADLLALLPLAPAAKLRRPMLRPKPVARGKKVLARK